MTFVEMLNKSVGPNAGIVWRDGKFVDLDAKPKHYEWDRTHGHPMTFAPGRIMLLDHVLATAL